MCLLKILVTAWVSGNLVNEILVARPVGVVVKNITIDAGGLGFDSGRSFRTQCRQRLATATMFLRSCVSQELSRGDGLRCLLHASA